jgi:putative restriction endonuclease
MRYFVGITDNQWFNFLSNLSDVDEVNFWQPNPNTTFKALPSGGLFLFKLHSPLNYIVGGGFYAHYTSLPVSLAWDAFEEKNGAATFEEMREKILKYRGKDTDKYIDFPIGCILLEQPFFFPRERWIPLRNWSPNIVRGKGFDTEIEEERLLYDQVMANKDYIKFPQELPQIGDIGPRYGEGILVKPRLGQGSFKVLVTDAYQRSCAITREKALPVLEAAHIKPYAESGPHEVKNGLLLRSDIHKLFDRGYMTVTPSHHIEVSRRIKEEFDNGKYYYSLHGKGIQLPERLYDQPSEDFLEWHNEKVFRG